jgi:hypothetical protein
MPEDPVDRKKNEDDQNHWSEGCQQTGKCQAPGIPPIDPGDQTYPYYKE